MSAPAIDLHRPGVPFARLVAVETRKVFDTRASRWFSFSILGLVLAIVLLVAFAFEQGAQDLDAFLFFVGNTLGYFLPIVLIMLVTSEWTQRTALVTFTMEPRRGRVVAAKLAAGLVLSLAALVLAFALSAVGVALASGVRGVDVSWSIGADDVRGFLLPNLILALVGFALAMLLLNTPAAIVAYLLYFTAVPLVANLLGLWISWFGDVVPWVVFTNALGPLIGGESMSGEEWAQLATAGTLWLVLPLAVGVWRVLRSEVK